MHKRSHTPKHRLFKPRRFWLLLAGIPLALLAAFSTYQLLTIVARNAASQQKFDSLLMANSTSVSASSPSAAQSAAGENADPKAERIARLFEQYPEMAGWLSIEDTKLDYPVMHTPDKPNYYLRRDLQGEYDVYGVPYLNEACDLQGSDNLIIYGHSIDNGDVFGSLLEYSSIEYFRRHPVIDLYTRDGPRQYTVLGAFLIDVTPETGDGFAYNDFVRADSKTAYDTFVSEVRARACYETDTRAVYGDQLLTLSTCEYTLPDGRFVVVAVRTA